MKYLLLITCLLLSGCAVLDAASFCNASPHHCKSDTKVSTITVNDNTYKVVK